MLGDLLPQFLSVGAITSDLVWIVDSITRWNMLIHSGRLDTDFLLLNHSVYRVLNHLDIVRSLPLDEPVVCACISIEESRRVRLDHVDVFGEVLDRAELIWS